ncbi:YgaP family membrane protein [Pseudoduganella sp. R-34]|uniref:YgaP family membrane protein n=1 Tax=Pseudoduganella sp. R-34 TaxID=3404062 RepID=UPI003CF3DE53
MGIKENIGTVDRALRVAVGLGLVIATLFGFIGTWGWIGVVPLLTGTIRFCPLYRAVGITTNGD